MNQTTLAAGQALVESQALRAQYLDRVDVLEKVKAIRFLSDDTHVDLPGVANYFEVGEEAIQSVVRRHREELENNGLKALKGADYAAFATVNLTGANPKARSITLFARRAILNVGQMLTESPVAEAIREFLLDAEAEIKVTVEHQYPIPSSFAEALSLAADQARAIEAQSEKIAELAPKAAQSDLYAGAMNLINLRSFARDVQLWYQRLGKSINQQVVFEYLGGKGLGLIIRGDTLEHNQATAWAIKNGYAENFTTMYQRSDLSNEKKKYALLTPKGEQYAWSKFYELVGGAMAADLPTPEKKTKR